MKTYLQKYDPSAWALAQFPGFICGLLTFDTFVIYNNLELT